MPCCENPPTAKQRCDEPDLPRLALMEMLGAAIGPVALAWRPQHTSGTGTSLMLSLEALFTALLAQMIYREVMDRRVKSAMLMLLAGGVVQVCRMRTTRTAKEVHLRRQRVSHGR